MYLCQISFCILCAFVVQPSFMLGSCVVSLLNLVILVGFSMVDIQKVQTQ